jgi:hypothetical protein
MSRYPCVGRCSSAPIRAPRGDVLGARRMRCSRTLRSGDVAGSLRVQVNCGRASLNAGAEDACGGDGWECPRGDGRCAPLSPARATRAVRCGERDRLPLEPVALAYECVCSEGKDVIPPARVRRRNGTGCGSRRQVPAWPARVWRGAAGVQTFAAVFMLVLLKKGARLLGTGAPMITRRGTLSPSGEGLTRLPRAR